MQYILYFFDFFVSRVFCIFCASEPSIYMQYQDDSEYNTWLRLRNLKNFAKRCHAAGARPFPVPGDGNCLIWSALRLTLGTGCPDPDSADGFQHMTQLRQGLHEAWCRHSTDINWQTVFGCVRGQDINAPKGSVKQQPVTPPEKRRRALAELSSLGPIDLLTPPRVSPKKKARVEKGDLPTPPRVSPKKKSRVEKHVGASRPAKISESAIPSSDEHGLRAPGHNAKRASFVEPQVTDVEERFSKMKMVPAAPEQSEDPVDSMDITALDDSAVQALLTEAENAPPPLVQLPEVEPREKHSRCAKRELSKTQKDDLAMRTWLARKGFTYGVFTQTHRRRCAIAQAGKCPDQGYVEFRNRLRTGKTPQCPVCVWAMEWYGISLETAADVLERGVDVVEPLPSAGSAPEEAEAEKPDAKASQTEEQDGVGEPDTEDDYLKCKKFVDSYRPHIEWVEGDNEKGYACAYRCHLCITRAQKHGKLNTLVHARFGYVERFLMQHINGDTHQKHLAAWQARQRAVEAPQDRDCGGLRVADHRFGSLHYYAEEFATFVSFLKLDDTCLRNKVWLDEGEWFIRAEDCLRKVSVDEPLCRRCEALSEPTRMPRRVVSFYKKYVAARLLKARLFLTQQQQQEIGTTSYFHLFSGFFLLNVVSNSVKGQWMRTPVFQFYRDLGYHRLISLHFSLSQRCFPF